MSHSTNVFPDCVQDKLFKTERGDVCLCLHEAWNSLLTDLGLLGAAYMITRSEQMGLVSICDRLDFVSIPGGTEMLELNSGVSLETLKMDGAMAGQEAETGNLSFHLFDAEGRGFLKVLLAPGADLDGFMRVVGHYAKRPQPLKPRSSLPRGIHRDEAIQACEGADLAKAWASFNPALGGNLLPGLWGVSWVNALRSVGSERALAFTKTGLIKAMLAAYAHQWRLRITICEEGLHHETLIVPRRLERCGQCIHLFDVEGEAHFFLAAESEIWLGFHGTERTGAIHIFSEKGLRRGVIEFADESHDPAHWNQALLAAQTSSSV